MPYWSLLVLSIPLYPCSKELFLSFLFKLASPVPFIGLCLSIVPLRGCSISIHFIIIKYENEHEQWCVGMVLMVVVVVAVGGVFAHLSAYCGEPRLPLNLWKSLWISLWKNLLEDTYLYAMLDGSLMCKIWLFGWAGHVQNKKTMGQGRGPKKRRRRHFVLSFSFMTCTWHDDIYMFILVIYMLLLAAFVAAVSCLCRCFWERESVKEGTWG